MQPCSQTPSQSHGKNEPWNSFFQMDPSGEDRNSIYDLCESHSPGTGKYSGKQPVAVRLYPKEGNTILEIEDKGIGIPEDEIQLIFQAFYRATNTREYSGHGIGLGLSLKILSIYGARMEILSKLNTYTRVLITFK